MHRRSDGKQSALMPALKDLDEEKASFYHDI